MQQKILKYIGVMGIVILFTSCSMKNNNINIKNKLNIPQNYNENSTKLNEDDSWLKLLKNKELLELISIALNNNYELKQFYYDVQIQKQKLISQNSSLFPSIDLSLKQSNSGTFDNQSSAKSTKANLSLTYEIDLWGKLSDLDKQANVNILASQANYEQKKQTLIHDVLLAYYNIQESMLLKNIYKQQVQSKEKSHEITSFQYTQGLSSVADVYLSKNSIYEKTKQITVLEVSSKQNIYTLEKLLSHYPKGKLVFKNFLPLLESEPYIGLPSSLILKKPSLVSSWNTLLAQNYQLAFAHKERFPSFSLSASLEKTAQAGVPLGWSLLGGITASIFDAGALKAKEEVERLELKKAELVYLDNVYSAFTDIENKIIEGKSLKKQYEIVLKSIINANKSEDITLEQYKQGISDYTDVISSQNTTFSLQVEEVQLKKKILNNQIGLHLAIGGDFTSKETLKENIK